MRDDNFFFCFFHMFPWQDIPLSSVPCHSHFLFGHWWSMTSLVWELLGFQGKTSRGSASAFRKGECSYWWVRFEDTEGEPRRVGISMPWITCQYTSKWGFWGGSVVKNLPGNVGDARGADSIPGSGRSSGVGNGNLLQYSCLENSMDRGPWWAIVHRVAKSWTWPSTHTYTSEHGHSNSSSHEVWGFWGPGCSVCAEGLATSFLFYTSPCTGHGLWRRRWKPLLLRVLRSNLLWLFLSLCWDQTRLIWLGVRDRTLAKNPSLFDLLCLVEMGGWF